MTLSRSTVMSWRPADLDGAADELDAARRLTQEATGDLRDAARSISASWTGEAADAASVALAAHTRRGEHLEDALSVLRRALRAASDTFAAAQSLLADAISYASSHGLTVQEDGSVMSPPAYVIPSSWSSAQQEQAHDEHQAMVDAARKAQAMARQALAAATEADEDAAHAIGLAWAATADGSGSDASDNAMIAAISGRDVPAPGTPADEVAAWWATLPPVTQSLMVARRWAEIGNLDGIPYDVRVRANTTAITAALSDVREHEAQLETHLAELRAQLPQPGQVPAGGRGYPDPGVLRAIAEAEAELVEVRATEARYDDLLNGSVLRYGSDGLPEMVRGHQVVIFDPGAGRFAEVVGEIDERTQNVSVLVGGTGTNETKMAGQYERALDFVQAANPPGSLAVINYLGGPMPQSILTDAPYSHFALDQAGALRDFVAGVDRPQGVPLTVVGHSYGGSVVGAAEAAGMVADRILHVESAGAGPNVFSVADYADPSTPRYSMTAPGDAIALTQGAQSGPLGHGADPDLLEGVTRLETGRNDDSDPHSGIVQGLGSHSGVFDKDTTSFANMLAVMTGGEVSLYTPPEMRVYAGAPQPVVVTQYPMEDPSFVPPKADVR